MDNTQIHFSVLWLSNQLIGNNNHLMLFFTSGKKAYSDTSQHG